MNRLQRLGERWSWLGIALGVHQRFSELHGGSVAAAVTLAAFVSIFPLLLAFVGIVGFFSSNGADVAGRIISELGLTGAAATTVQDAISTAEATRRAASIVGILGLLWAGLGLVAALEYSIDTAWQVTGRGLKAKLFALGWLVGAGALFIGSFALSALLNFLPGFATPIAVLIGLAVSVLLFWWTFVVLGNRDFGWRPLLPGALLAGAGFEVLKEIGTVYVPRLVASSSALYGSIGVVFAILAWLFFFGRLIVYASVLNVVLYERSRGTVTVEIEAPRIPGEVAIAANRSGAVTDRTTAGST